MTDKPNFIEEYLISKGLEYKFHPGTGGSAPQFIVKKNIDTGEEKWNHFYINAENGTWYNQKSGNGGNFNQLRARMGDDAIELPEMAAPTQRVQREYKVIPYEQARIYAQRLWGLEPDLLRYLKEERGLEDATIKHFKLGVDSGNITIPIFDRNDVLANIRKRRDPKLVQEGGNRYSTEPGCKSVLFNESALDKGFKEIYITEGEFDAMTLWQNGIKNVVSITLGAGYFSKEWVEQFSGIKKIFLAYDNDEAGREGAAKAAEMLGKDRCKIIELPNIAGEKKTDINEFFVKHKKSKEDFLSLVRKAVSPVAFDSESIKHISDFNDELRKRILEGEYTGISTGYEELDKVIGGYRKGRVIVLSGLTSVGKTTFSNNLTLNLAHRNIPVMYISMEMPPIDICRKFLLLHKKLTGSEVDRITDETDALMPTIDAGLMEFKGSGSKPGLPIYIFNSTGAASLNSVLDVSRVAKEVYGVELLVIDHLHYFGNSTGNRAAEIANITRSIKTMAMELDIPVLLLAHLNRAGRSQQRRGMYVPTLADLKDAGAIEQDADQVVFVCRDSEAVDENEKRKSIIKVAKNRDGKTGHVSNDFDLATGYFSEVSGVDYMESFSSKLVDSSKGGATVRDARGIFGDDDLEF